MKRRLFLFFATITILIFSGQRINAATLEVCPNGEGCTYEYTGGGAVNAIQTAIDAATDGDTVYIHNGTYASPEIDMTSAHTGITVEGQSLSGVVLDESYFRIGSAANGAATNITVKNLTIRDSYDINNGIEIVISTGVILRNLSITGSGGEGIKVLGNATVDIYNVIVSDGNSTGLRLNGSAAEVDVYNCKFSSNTYQGVLVEDMGILNFVNNRVTGNGTVGVQVNQGTTIDFTNNNIYDNGTYGMNVSSVTSLTNDYNNVYSNTSGEYTGSITAGSNSVSVNPDINVSGVLNCTSTLINAGDPTITDVDTTCSDIGMYGGPNSGFDSNGYICSASLFCHVTASSHVCIECLIDSDCTGAGETCNTNDNTCEVLGTEDEPNDEGDDVEDDTGDDIEESPDLPATSMYSEDPVFYTILSLFLVITGYVLYAQAKYGKDTVEN